MFKKYINNPLLFDFILVILCFIIYINIDLIYIKSPEFIFSIIGLPGFLIFNNSEKIKRLRKSKQFPKIVIYFFIYFFILNTSSYLLNNNLITNNLIFNFTVSIFIISLLRIGFFSIIITSFWLKSITK